MESAALSIAAVILCLLICACADNGFGAAKLQTRIDQVVSQYPGATIAVSVRDPSTGTFVDVNADSLIHAASTMKVPVLIELYRQAEAGYFSLDDSIDVRNEFISIFDGSTYTIAAEDDSDKDIYETVGGRLTVRDLAYRLITSSSNLATNLLVDLVKADSIQSTIESLGVRDMRVIRGVEDTTAFRAGMNNVATAADLATLMVAIMQERAVSPVASRDMVATMADVPSFKMISAGVPPGTRVAHKTGAIPTRNHRHDAAIVYPPSADPYVIVILTRDTRSVAEAEGVGRVISETVYKSLRG